MPYALNLQWDDQLKDERFKTFTPGQRYLLSDLEAWEMVGPGIEFPSDNSEESMAQYKEKRAELARRYCVAVVSSEPVVQGCHIAPCTIMDEDGNRCPWWKQPDMGRSQMIEI